MINLVNQNKHHQWRIQSGFATGQPVWDPKFLPQINKKLKMLK